jgi:enoyl-CoA hydratase/carnithine racemase
MIQSRKQDGILTIRFNRPEKKNAFTRAMYLEFRDALISGDLDTTVKVILLCGSGNTFTAGNDIADFLESSFDEQAPPILLLRALAGLKKPLIAAVDGPAVGIGSTMLFHCDLVYAHKDAQFIFPFVTLGLVPEGAITLLLPRLVGHQRASEALFFGEPLTAEQAQDMGFVNKVIADESALPYANSRAKVLSSLPSGSILQTKALLKNAMVKSEVLEQISAEAKIFMERLNGPAAKEAFNAFIEKRAPKLHGLD